MKCLNDERIKCIPEKCRWIDCIRVKQLKKIEDFNNIKCDIYPCILVRKGYVTNDNHFCCVAFERNSCVWKDI